MVIKKMQWAETSIYVADSSRGRDTIPTGPHYRRAFYTQKCLN
jgi:hypothetical protein